MKKLFIILSLITGFTLESQAQSTTKKDNDFGTIVSIGVEKKLAKRLSLSIEADNHTQRDAERTERWLVGTSLSYKFFQSSDKRFNLKSSIGFDYIWRQKLTEAKDHYGIYEGDDGDIVVNDGANITYSHWRKRQRYSLGLSGTYNPSKRWSFSIKEIFQYNHYCTASADRVLYRNIGEETYTNTVKSWSKKDRLVLRNRLSAEYNIKGLPLNPFAVVDYGVGLNYNASKWKLTGGLELKVQKQHQFEVFYRFVHENDDDEPNGHYVGWGYKYSF